MKWMWDQRSAKSNSIRERENEMGSEGEKQTGKQKKKKKKRNRGLFIEFKVLTAYRSKRNQSADKQIKATNLVLLFRNWLDIKVAVIQDIPDRDTMIVHKEPPC